MKNIIRFFNKVLQIPSSVSNDHSVFSESLVMIRGHHHILIQQHYRIMSFSQTEVTLQTNNKTIHIKGTNLYIKMMYPQEIVLEGDIKEIKFI